MKKQTEFIPPPWYSGGYVPVFPHGDYSLVNAVTKAISIELNETVYKTIKRAMKRYDKNKRKKH